MLKNLYKENLATLPKTPAPHSTGSVVIIDMPHFKFNNIKVSRCTQISFQIIKICRFFLLFWPFAKVLLWCVLLFPATVQVEDANILSIGGERRRNEKEKGELKYICMEGRVHKEIEFKIA